MTTNPDKSKLVNDAQLSIYSQLINMGFADGVSFDAAYKFPNDVEQAMEYVLAHNTEDVEQKDDIKDEKADDCQPQLQHKDIDHWSSDELIKWIKTINLETNTKTKIIQDILEQTISGEDFNSLQSPIEIMDSFDGINKTISEKLYKELIKIRKSDVHVENIQNSSNEIDIDEKNATHTDNYNIKHNDIYLKLLAMGFQEHLSFEATKKFEDNYNEAIDYIHSLTSDDNYEEIRENILINSDFFIFEQKHAKDYCDTNAHTSIIDKCAVLTRIVAGLTYYSALDMNDKYAKHKILFNKFINNTYHQFLDDYTHLIEQHQHQLEEINHSLLNDSKYQFRKCHQLNSCEYTSRHHGTENNKINKTKIADTKFHFYRQTMDSLHFYLFHMFHCGLRSVNLGMVDNNQNTVFERRYLASTFDRFKSRKKFNISIKTEARSNEDETYLDHLYKFLSKNNIAGDVINRLKLFVYNQKYDTDSLEFDIYDEVGNFSLLDNDHLLKSLTVFVKSMKLQSSSFSIGIIWYYWPYYEKLKQLPLNDNCSNNDHGGELVCDLLVKPKYKDFGEEMSFYNYDCDVQIGTRKVNEYLKTNSVKRVQRAEEWSVSDLHYDVQKDAPLGFHNLIALLFYTDFTALSNDFTKSFRALDPLEKLSIVKRRNCHYYWWSKILRETVQLFGGCRYGDRNRKFTNSLCGPFYTGMSYEMPLPTFNIRLCSPTSTSPQIEVAERFAGREGIMIQLNNRYDELLRAFDVSWLGTFKEEDETLFVGGNRTLEIESVISIKTATNFKALMKALYYLDCVVSGGDVQKLKTKSSQLHVIHALIKWKRTKQKDDIVVNMDEYGYEIFDSFLLHKKQIVLRLYDLDEHVNDSLKNVIMSKMKKREAIRDEYDNINLFNKELFKLFDRVRSIVVYTTGEDEQGHYSYSLSLTRLLSLIEETTLCKIEIKAMRPIFNPDEDTWISSLWTYASKLITQTYHEKRWTISFKSSKDDKGAFMVTEDSITIDTMHGL